MTMIYAAIAPEAALRKLIYGARKPAVRPMALRSPVPLAAIETTRPLLVMLREPKLNEHHPPDLTCS